MIIDTVFMLRWKIKCSQNNKTFAIGVLHAELTEMELLM